ncbi:hypothetical protein FACS1894206_08290 [Deltaproteobacteria bacterium]|nr:hypothetical protein FACS1894206_08290 [Deltaproteobacteria bacterium]
MRRSAAGTANLPVGDFCRRKVPFFFTDALALVLDGFDAPFIRKWMKRFKSTALEDVQRKIALSIDLCLAIQERVTFEETRFLVRSYIR